MKILIIDDTETNRIVLGAMLRQDSHLVCEATDGHEGVLLFDREQPDLVITDIMMPVMDGYQAATIIKQRAGERFVPVIFLTSVTDEDALAKCIMHGGDDFLTKPYSHVLLRAKLQALNRIRKLHGLIKAQNQALLAGHTKDEQEREVARVIFEKILGAGCLTHPNLTYRLSAAEVLSGDLLLAALTPHGLLHIMLGDFTGHGLAAAVGAVPAAEVFYGMTQRGFGIGNIAAEINEKLRRILPSNLFCAACLLEWDPAERRITIWNGGMPEGLVIRPAQGVQRRLLSRHLPLSLLPPDQFDPSTETFEVQPHDRVCLYSDGLTEARNPAGDMFGSDRLEWTLVLTEDPERICDQIEHDLMQFCAGERPEDDIALVQLTCAPSLVDARPRLPVARTAHANTSRNWHVELALDADALHHIDPLPTLMRTLTDLQDLAGHTHTIFIILAELVTNAIDHGLLGLDSSLKLTPEGFAHYYERREQQLMKLQEGTLCVHVEHDREAQGERLVIRVADNGSGFAFCRVVSGLCGVDTNQRYSGRGIPLVRSLCHTLNYHGSGNTVEAVYRWH